MQSVLYDDDGGRGGIRALHEAVQRDDVNTVRELMAQHGNAIALTQSRHTLLREAACYGCVEVMRELIVHHGADVNAISVGGCTPLHNATQNHRIEAIKALMIHGKM